MESGFWASVKATIHEERGRLASRPYKYKGINLLSSLLSDYRGEGALMERGWMKNMQIIIFSIKFYKFTGFFDKFLKIISPVNDCNKTGYHINLSVPHSDPAAKKVFRRPRICPQPPAFPPAPHRALKPSFINRV